MQIRPETGKWLAKKIHMKWKGKKTLKDMEKIVILGATFLSMLRKQFNSHGRLYVSAYNIGARGVQRQIASAGPWPRSYALRVMRNYLDLYEELGQSKEPKEPATN
jgi:soluble lytic murein transglycosylase-like protein